MLVDIHTHNSQTFACTAIRNITFLEAESFLFEQEKGLFSIGFHPWFADTYSVELFENLEKYASHKRVIAIGECGLDKNSDVPYEIQLLVFEKQISLSEKVHKPLIIHCVGYFNELFALKKTLHPTQLWIIHGFRGKPQLAEQALKAGCALSFGERYNEESVRVTPLDKLFVETDESTQSIKDIYKRLTTLKVCKTAELVAGKNLLAVYGF